MNTSNIDETEKDEDLADTEEIVFYPATYYGLTQKYDKEERSAKELRKQLAEAQCTIKDLRSIKRL